MKKKLVMDSFSRNAKVNGFLKFNHSWYKQTEEVIIILSFQKSNYGNYFDLNIKIFIQGIFNKRYELTKEIFKDTGDIFRRQPKSYNDLFNMDSNVLEEEIEKAMKDFFTQFLIPFTDSMNSKKGILQFHEENPSEIYLLPIIKEHLSQLLQEFNF